MPGLIKRLLIFCPLLICGCRSTILHKDAAKEVIEAGTKSLGNELRPALKESIESVKGYLDSLKINKTLDQTNELMGEISALTNTMNKQLETGRVDQLILSINDTTTKLNTLIDAINKSVDSEDFTQLKNDLKEIASTVKEITSKFNKASSENDNSTQILIYVVCGLLIALALSIAAFFIFRKK